MADDETVDKETGEKKPGTSHTWAESYRDVRDMLNPKAKAAAPAREADKPLRTQSADYPKSQSTKDWLAKNEARDKAAKLPKTRKKAAR